MFASIHYSCLYMLLLDKLPIFAISYQYNLSFKSRLLDFNIYQLHHLMNSIHTNAFWLLSECPCISVLCNLCSTLTCFTPTIVLPIRCHTTPTYLDIFVTLIINIPCFYFFDIHALHAIEVILCFPYFLAIFFMPLRVWIP